MSERFNWGLLVVLVVVLTALILVQSAGAAGDKKVTERCTVTQVEKSSRTVSLVHFTCNDTNHSGVFNTRRSFRVGRVITVTGRLDAHGFIYNVSSAR